MKPITNQFIIDSMNSYIHGEAESIRPFSSTLKDDKGETINAHDLYIASTGEVCYPLYNTYTDDIIEGNIIRNTDITDYTILMSREDYVKQNIAFKDYILSKNNIEDLDQEDKDIIKDIIKEIEEYINNK